MTLYLQRVQVISSTVLGTNLHIFLFLKWYDHKKVGNLNTKGSRGFRPVLGRLRLRKSSTWSRLWLLVKENKSLDFLKLTTNCLKYVLTHVPVHMGPNLDLL